uniref:Uncharacterized protein n=1 Tax=Oryza meridionalis TaxID=40149 RepID=A0A0E0ESX4_9ORYZ
MGRPAARGEAVAGFLASIKRARRRQLLPLLPSFPPPRRSSTSSHGCGGLGGGAAPNKKRGGGRRGEWERRPALCIRSDALAAWANVQSVIGVIVAVLVAELVSAMSLATMM